MARPEDRLQMRSRMFLDACLAVPHYWSSIAHERKQSPASGQRQKARGVRAGLPDIIIIVAGYVLAVELKSATGTVTPSQAATAGKLRELGHGYSVVRSIQQLGEEITRAGILLTPNWQVVAARHDAELHAIAPAKKRLAAPKAKPTLSQIARGNRFSLVGAKGGK